VRSLGRWSQQIPLPPPDQILPGIPEHFAELLVGIDNCAVFVLNAQSLIHRFHQHAEELFAFAQRFFSRFALGDIANRLDSPGQPALGIIEGRSFPPEVGPLPAVDEGRVSLGIEILSLPLHQVISLLRAGLAGHHEIDQNGFGFTIERNGVEIVTLAENLLLCQAGDLLHGAVPGDHPAVGIDHKSGVGKKLDDVQGLLVRELNRFSGLFGRWF